MQYLISFEGHKIYLHEKYFKVVFLKNLQYLQTHSK